MFLHPGVFLTLQCPSPCSHRCWAQLCFAPTGVWSFPRALWLLCWWGRTCGCVDAVSGGCCHQQQNASVLHNFHTTNSFEALSARYPLKGVSGVLHCWFPKGRNNRVLGADPWGDSEFPAGMWLWTEGGRCSWSQESSGLTGGSVSHGGGKEGFLATTQGQAAGDLQHCSICPDLLDVEQSQRCAEGLAG